MDPGRGELVLRVEILLVASDSLFIPPVTSGSSKMGRRLRDCVYQFIVYNMQAFCDT